MYNTHLVYHLYANSCSIDYYLNENFDSFYFCIAFLAKINEPLAIFFDALILKIIFILLLVQSDFERQLCLFKLYLFIYSLY
jgi:hypothetical protein